MSHSAIHSLCFILLFTWTYLGCCFSHSGVCNIDKFLDLYHEHKNYLREHNRTLAKSFRRRDDVGMGLSVDEFKKLFSVDPIYSLKNICHVKETNNTLYGFLKPFIQSQRERLLLGDDSDKNPTARGLDDWFRHFRNEYDFSYFSNLRDLSHYFCSEDSTKCLLTDNEIYRMGQNTFRNHRCENVSFDFFTKSLDTHGDRILYGLDDYTDKEIYSLYVLLYFCRLRLSPEIRSYIKSITSDTNPKMASSKHDGSTNDHKILGGVPLHRNSTVHSLPRKDVRKGRNYTSISKIKETRVSPTVYPHGTTARYRNSIKGSIESQETEDTSEGIGAHSTSSSAPHRELSRRTVDYYETKTSESFHNSHTRKKHYSSLSGDTFTSTYTVGVPITYTVLVNCTESESRANTEHTCCPMQHVMESPNLYPAYSIKKISSKKFMLLQEF